jgi:transposase, IS5 family
MDGLEAKVRNWRRNSSDGWTQAWPPKGGHFVLHAKALHGNPCDGQPLGPVIADLEKLTAVAVGHIYGDKGCRGHNHPDRFKVWISGQVRRVTQSSGARCGVAPPSSL